MQFSGNKPLVGTYLSYVLGEVPKFAHLLINGTM